MADRMLAPLAKRIDAAEQSAKPSRTIDAACAAALRSLVARERDVLGRLGAP